MVNQDAVTARVVIVGEAGVGKSSLLVRFVRDQFTGFGGATIGVEFNAKQVSAAERQVKLQCWDCAGAERFRAISRSYFRGYAAAILVFDLGSRESFQALDYWLNELRQNCKNPPNRDYGPPIIVLGNKCDAAQVVTREEIDAWCRVENLPHYFEVSAKNGNNVHRSFASLAQLLSDSIELAQGNGDDPRKVIQGLTFASDIMMPSDVQVRLARKESKQDLKQRCWWF